MLYVIYSVVGLAAVVLILTRVSDALADWLSRSMESVFDFIEYRVASKAEHGYGELQLQVSKSMQPQMNADWHR